MEEQQGPFDRILESEPPEQRDRVAVAIVGAAILLGLILLALVLPPISILDDGGDASTTGGGRIATTKLDELPAPPAGYAAVSGFLDLSEGQPSESITVSLSTTVGDGDPLVFFTYADGKWRQVGNGVAVAGGTAASADLKSLPDNVAVFSAREQARAVLGSLPLGAQLDERATNVLTTLNPAGLVPAADGSVAGTVPQNAANGSTPIVPSVRAVQANDADAVNRILGSEALRTAHVEALLLVARNGNFAGLDIDYRAIDPSLADAFVVFVRALSAGLRSEQRTLTLTLPLPVRDGASWNTHGYDWEVLAPLTDTFKLAPEANPEQYFARTQDAIEYLVPRVGSEKLVLGVGPRSHERSVDGLRALTLSEALALASTPTLEGSGPVAPAASVGVVGQNLAAEMGGSGLHWDDAARALAFTYTGAGGNRTVWIANRFSEAFKLDLAARYQLGGVYVDNVSRGAGDANIWPVVRNYAQTGAVALVKPNGQLLQPHWTASAGTFDSETGASVTWHAPNAAGAQTLTLVVSDGVVRMGQELQVTVEAPAGAVAR
ncbi:MAG: hypothetical protein WBD55_03000 [Dehalococcoidia bacterium]